MFYEPNIQSSIFGRNSNEYMDVSSNFLHTYLDLP